MLFFSIYLSYSIIKDSKTMFSALLLLYGSDTSKSV